MMDQRVPFIVTIDGPSGSGKGTIAKRLAAEYGLRLLDSGALYRVLGLAARRHGVDLADEPAIEMLALSLDVRFDVAEQNDGVQVILEGDDVSREIRTEEAGAAASLVAAITAVRSALLQRQRDFSQIPGLVADGRDMGTEVFPAAQVKVFLTASAQERARRRCKQLVEKGFDANLKNILDDVQARDARDTQRSASPLRPAEDACVLDCTDLSVEQVVEQIRTLITKGLSG
ncbi:MAG: cytidylate kinase [Motiliproteus sp.]|jgi:cytidylate kinase